MGVVSFMLRQIYPRNRASGGRGEEEEETQPLTGLKLRPFTQ
jgi:hypothetical protein